RGAQDIQRYERGQRVAQPGNQPDDGVQAEPDSQTRNLERAVHPSGQQFQLGIDHRIEARFALDRPGVNDRVCHLPCAPLKVPWNPCAFHADALPLPNSTLYRPSRLKTDIDRLASDRATRKVSAKRYSVLACACSN